MTVFRGAQMTKLVAETNPDPGDVHGNVYVFNETVTFATQTTSDTIEVARIPKGAKFLYGILQTTVTLATATLAVGITGTVAKYRVAAVLTAIVPEVFGIAANSGVELTAEEVLFLTIAVASLPASGTLRVKIFYTFQ